MSADDSSINRPGKRLGGNPSEETDSRKRSSKIPPPPQGKSMLTHRQAEGTPPPPALRNPNKPSAQPEPPAEPPASPADDNKKTMKVTLDSAAEPEQEPPEPPPAATPLPSRSPPTQDPSASTSSRQLRETMRKIHAREETADSPEQRELHARELAKRASTLPEAMARVHRENRFQATLNRALNEDPSPDIVPEEVDEETAYAVDDPHPGGFRGLLYFLFSFGHFANGVQLAQPVWATLTFWILCGLGALLPLMPLLLPSNPGPERFMTPEYLGPVLGLGFCIGLAAVLAISLLFNLTVWARFGRVGLLFGLRTVTGALLPLALVQLTAFALSFVLLGEAFLRGATLPWFLTLQIWGLPLLWVWGGLRLGQAVSRMARPPFYASALILIFLPLLFAATYVPLHPALTQWRIDRLSATKADIQRLREFNPMQRLAACQDFAAQLPFWAMEDRRELHFTQLDLYLAMNDIRSARAEMLLLDRASIPDSSVDLVAKSVNLYLARDQVEEERRAKVQTLVETLLHQAVNAEDAVVNAYDWLSILQEETSVEAAASTAGDAYRFEPSPKRFQRYIDLLYRLQSYETMWDIMLQETSPPPQWPVHTLEQLAQAADQQGKPKRASQLRQWATPRTATSSGTDSDTE